MNKVLLLLLFIFSLITNAQELRKQDSINILFKAKLLTTNEYGINHSKESILRDIEQQNTTFLKTVYKNFVFIKVEFTQKYNVLGLGIVNRFGKCSYYLAFGIKTSRFYKLGGFDTLDVDDFLEDFRRAGESTIFNGVEGNEIEEIDIYCLYDYSELSLRKRRKNGYSCIENCKEIITTTIRQ